MNHTQHRWATWFIRPLSFCPETPQSLEPNRSHLEFAKKHLQNKIKGERSQREDICFFLLLCHYVCLLFFYYCKHVFTHSFHLQWNLFAATLFNLHKICNSSLLTGMVITESHRILSSGSVSTLLSRLQTWTCSTGTPIDGAVGSRRNGRGGGGGGEEGVGGDFLSTWSWDRSVEKPLFLNLRGNSLAALYPLMSLRS